MEASLELTVTRIISTPDFLQLSICFTVADTTGYFNNSHISWKGILFDETPATNDSSKIVHSVIEFAKKTAYQWPDDYAGGLLVIHFDKLLLQDSAIRNNRSLYYGGGITLLNSAIKMNNNIISFNTCQNFGGGLAIIYSYYVHYFGNTVRNNTAQKGGGIYIETAGGSGAYTGFIIEYKGFTVYYAGDTAYDSKIFKEIGDKFKTYDI